MENSNATKSNFIEGLIIKEDSNGEKNKLLHVLTADKGVVILKAPGAKSLKSSTHSACSLFTYSEFSFAKGKSPYLTVTGAVAKNNFFNLRNDVLAYALACYISYVAGKVSVNDSSSGDVLRLTLNCFYALSELKYNPDIVKPIFELKIASVCGFAPELEHCPHCGEKSDTFAFDYSSFGMLCKKCLSQAGDLVKNSRFFRLNENVISIVRYISYCDIKKIFNVKAALENPENENDARIFYDFCQGILRNVLEYEPKTLSFYNQITRSIKK